MTTQRLYQMISGVVDSHGRVTLSFPAVPQGLCWSGTISLYSPPTVTPGLNPVLDQGPLQGSFWWLARNQAPVLQWSGPAVAADIQALGQETITLQGYGMTSGRTVQAVWNGWSDDQPAVAPILTPQVYGVTAPYMQVYTSTPGAPLDVAVTTASGRSLGVASARLAAASSTAVLLAANSNAAYQLQAVQLSVSIADDGTTAQQISWTGKVQLNNGTTQTTLLALEPIVIQTSTQCATQEFGLFGLPVNFDQDVELVTSSFGGTGTVVRANASLVYSYTPTTP